LVAAEDEEGGRGRRWFDAVPAVGGDLLVRGGGEKDQEIHQIM
jgi:hypothetical protein